MGYVIAVFKSRNEALRFFKVLSSYNIKANIIATPKIEGLACGVSLKLSKDRYQEAKKLLYRFRPQSFDGFYYLKRENGSLVANRL